jgi:hypothetical protein
MHPHPVAVKIGRLVELVGVHVDPVSADPVRLVGHPSVIGHVVHLVGADLLLAGDVQTHPLQAAGWVAHVLSVAIAGRQVVLAADARGGSLSLVT